MLLMVLLLVASVSIGSCGVDFSGRLCAINASKNSIKNPCRGDLVVPLPVIGKSQTKQETNSL